MADAARLLRTIREAGKSPESETVDMVYGTVKTTTPMTISIEGGLELTEEFLIFSPFAIDSSKVPKGSVSTTTTCTDGTCESKSSCAFFSFIQPLFGIKANDKVLMLRCGKGQKFYVLHKVT